MANLCEEQAETALGETFNPRRQHQPYTLIDPHHDLAITFLLLPQGIQQKILTQTFSSQTHQIRVPAVPEDAMTHSQYNDLKSQGKRKLNAHRCGLELSRRRSRLGQRICHLFIHTWKQTCCMFSRRGERDEL